MGPSWRSPSTMRLRICFVFTLGGIFILSYVLHRKEVKLKMIIFRGLGKTNEVNPVPEDTGDRDNSWQQKDIIQSLAEMVAAKKEKEIEDILAKLDQQMPHLTFSNTSGTTSAKKSKATILNPKGSYCVGEHLMVQLDLYDHSGNRKKYGGDFLRARIYSPSLKAGASGNIEDFGNGTYLVNFTLFWEGDARVSILLIHPSEGVSALWAARKKSYDKIAFIGKFLNGTSEVTTECGFNLSRNAELCEYHLDEQDQEVFYCLKPKHVPCGAFIELRSYNRPISYLSALEQSLFKRSNIRVEIPQKFGKIQVVPYKGKVRPTDKCQVGMDSPIPSGYLLRDAWHPTFCSVSNFTSLDKIQACLWNKMVYLMGDSTAFQWIHYLSHRLTTLKSLEHFGIPVFKTRLDVDIERNTVIQWKKHGLPLITHSFYSVTDLGYVAREIHQLPGGRDTAIVIALGQHFRPLPVDLFVRRLVNVRHAVEDLLLRSPDTKVIIKAENIREMYGDTERFGNFHGYAQYLVTKDVFQGLNVGMVDAWDMTVAYNTNNVHPPEQVVWSQIMMFLTYLC